MSRFQRRHRFKNPKKFFIIATEGECTEEIYFNALKPPRNAAIQLKVLPANKGKLDPRRILERLRRYEREAGAGRQDQLWLVIDRDCWPVGQLDAVAEEVNKLPNYHLAVSNPCFELWLLLHLCDPPPAATSDQLRTLLKQKNGPF